MITPFTVFTRKLVPCCDYKVFVGLGGGGRQEREWAEKQVFSFAVCLIIAVESVLDYRAKQQQEICT